MSRVNAATRLIAVCLIATLGALPASASSVSAHCTRDGTRARCAWSMVQPVVLVDWTSPKSQPVPLCLDCAPMAVELTCALVDDGVRAAAVRCIGAIEATDAIDD